MILIIQLILKGQAVPKNFIGFKGPLEFYKNIKEGYITLEKAEEKQKEFKSETNEVVKGSKKIRRSKNEIKSIKTLCESRGKVIKLFDGYYRMLSEAKYKTKYGEGLKTLTPALEQLKANNTSGNLLNEIRQIIFFCIESNKLLKKYVTIL